MNIPDYKACILFGLVDLAFIWQYIKIWRLRRLLRQWQATSYERESKIAELIDRIRTEDLPAVRSHVAPGTAGMTSLQKRIDQIDELIIL